MEVLTQEQAAVEEEIAEILSLAGLEAVVVLADILETAVMAVNPMVVVLLVQAAAEAAEILFLLGILRLAAV
jgi:hypothetical protein